MIRRNVLQGMLGLFGIGLPSGVLKEKTIDSFESFTFKGQKHFLKNGKVFLTESKEALKWWENDLLHRTDGPAVEWASGSKE